MLENARRSCQLNNLSLGLNVLGLSWGSPLPVEVALVDTILAADCLFDKSVFENFVATVEGILRHPDRQGVHTAECLLTYQERNHNHTLDELLEAYGLHAERIDVAAFLGDSAWTSLETVQPQVSEVHLLRITAQQLQ